MRFVDDSDKGLYRKYEVVRVDNRDAPGEVHEDCQYFVLDLTHDPIALKVAKYYAAISGNVELIEELEREEWLDT